MLNDYLMLRALDASAPYLSQPFVDAHFAFHGTVLNGTPQNEPRWKRGVTLVTDNPPVLVRDHAPALVERDSRQRNAPIAHGPQHQLYGDRLEAAGAADTPVGVELGVL